MPNLPTNKNTRRDLPCALGNCNLFFMLDSILILKFKIIQVTIH